MFTFGVNHKPILCKCHDLNVLGFCNDALVHHQPDGCTYIRKMLSYIPSNTHPQSSTIVRPRNSRLKSLLRRLREDKLLPLEPDSRSMTSGSIRSR